MEYHPLITPRVGNQAVIFDVDGVLTTPGGMICPPPPARTLAGLADANARSPAAQRSYPDARSSRLLTADKSRRETLVQNLRQQLQEIRQSLHRRLPVYVVLTRLDLLNGFAALFHSLDKKTAMRSSASHLPAAPMKVTAGAANWGLSGRRGYNRVNLALSDLVLAQTGAAPRSAVFSFSVRCREQEKCHPHCSPHCWTVRTWM